MTFDADILFETELRTRGISFEKTDQDLYELTTPTGKLTASLDNVRRNAERDEDPDAIARFVEAILAIGRNEPSWDEAKTLLFWSTEPCDAPIAQSVHFPVTDTICRVLTLTDASQSTVTWVSPSMCDRWGVDVDTAASIASSNQSRLLDELSLETSGEGDRLEVLGMIPLHPPYKASVIFASAFKSFVEPVLGWPVLVVLPCRDFVYILADGSQLLNRIGSVVVREFRNSGYPITTEVLRVSDEGIKAIGRFPT